MDHLDEEQMARLRDLLEAEKGRLDGQIASIEGRSVDGLAEDVGDEQDVPAQEADRERDARLVERHRARILDIDAALTRMADGTYGVCEETGEDIPFRRLELEPTTRYTVAALELLESNERKERPDGETVY